MAHSPWTNEYCPEKLTPWKINCDCFTQENCDCGKSHFYNVKGPDSSISCAKVQPCKSSLPDQVLPIVIPSDTISSVPKRKASITRESRHFKIVIFDALHSFITSEWDSYCLENNWMLWQTKDDKIYRQYAGFCRYDWLHEEFKLEDGKVEGLLIESNIESFKNKNAIMSIFEPETNNLPGCPKTECAIFRHSIMLGKHAEREILLYKGKEDQWTCVE